MAAAEGDPDEVLFSYAPQLPGCVEREGRITYGHSFRKGVLLSTPGLRQSHVEAVDPDNTSRRRESTTVDLRAELNRALEHGRTIEALEIYELVEKRKPDEPRWSHRKGDLLRRMGRQADALLAYERAAYLCSARGFDARAVATAKLISAIDPQPRSCARAGESRGRMPIAPTRPPRGKAWHSSSPLTGQAIHLQLEPARIQAVWCRDGQGDGPPNSEVHRDRSSMDLERPYADLPLDLSAGSHRRRARCMLSGTRGLGASRALSRCLGDRSLQHHQGAGHPA